MDELIFHIDRLGIFGRYSISATLLAGDTRTQRNYASYGPVLARRTKHDGKEHTRVELVPTLDDGAGFLFGIVGPVRYDPQISMHWSPTFMRKAIFSR